MNQQLAPDQASDPNTLYIIQDICGDGIDNLMLRSNLDDAVDCAIRCMKTTITLDMADGVLDNELTAVAEFFAEWNSMTDERDIQGLCDAFSDLYRDKDFKPGVTVFETILNAAPGPGCIVWNSVRGFDARIPI